MTTSLTALLSGTWPGEIGQLMTVRGKPNPFKYDDNDQMSINKCVLTIPVKRDVFRQDSVGKNPYFQLVTYRIWDVFDLWNSMVWVKVYKWNSSVKIIQSKFGEIQRKPSLFPRMELAAISRFEEWLTNVICMYELSRVGRSSLTSNVKPWQK